MSDQMTLEQLEQQVTQLPPQEQLRLVARISERLSAIPLAVTVGEESLRQQREIEADKLLALCDKAAEMWNGAFDAVAEISQARQKRDEQIWPNKS